MTNRHRRRHEAIDFLAESGSGWMKLSRHAAEEIITDLASRMSVVVKIEGGIWRDPGFEARLDQIWDSIIDPPVTDRIAYRSNQDALNFVRTRPSLIDTFILTCAPFAGYEHNAIGANSDVSMTKKA